MMCSKFENLQKNVLIFNQNIGDLFLKEEKKEKKKKKIYI